MRNQLITAVYSALACAMLTACETDGAYGSGGVIHSAVAPLPPNTFTQIDLTDGYDFRRASIPAQTISNVATSETMRHESEELKLHHTETLTHSGYADDASRGLLLNVDVDIPEGWTQTGEDAVRHDLSGLTCRLSFEVEDKKARYLLINIERFDTVNRDVACQYGKDDKSAVITVFATHIPDVTLEQMASSVTASIRSSYNIGEVLSVLMVEMKGDGNNPLLDGMEPQIAGGFDIGDMNGVRYKTSLWLATTYGWHVKVRATYPKDDASTEILSAINFAFSHLAVRLKNMNEPVSGGAEV